MRHITIGTPPGKVLNNKDDIWKEYNFFIQYPVKYLEENGVKVEFIPVDILENSNTHFLIPIFYAHEGYKDLIEHEKLNIPEYSLPFIRRGQAKAFLSFETEGFFGSVHFAGKEKGVIQPYTWFKYIDKACKNLSLPPSSLIVSCANLKVEDSYKNYLSSSSNPTQFIDLLYPHDWFKFSKWVNVGKSTPYPELDRYNAITKNYDLCFDRMLNSKIKHVPIKHFLCLNRRRRYPRGIIAAELLSNPKLINKSFVSLGGGSPSYILNEVQGRINKNYNPNNHINLINWSLENSSKLTDGIGLDTTPEELTHTNQANNITHYHCLKSFLYIVTETLQHSSTIFFSEKITKPIICAQPFILISSPGSLANLKSRGYKTFSQWWDESYDDELDDSTRLSKIVSILEDISNLSLEECHKMYLEMIPILKHNIKVLLDPKEKIEQLIKLSNYSKEY